MASGKSITEYYEAFTPRFIDDYVRGNRRVDRQIDFFVAAMNPNASRVLVVGSGSGQATQTLARRMPRTRFVAIDLSGPSIDLAKRLFAHPRVEYRVADVLGDAIPEKFDAILLPDIFEHIPLDQRERMHQRLAHLLGDRGQILLTVPSPQHQNHLRAHGGLQIVDEIVTVPDLLTMAEAVAGELTYLNSVTVWAEHDYWHAVVERAAETLERRSPRELPTLRGLDHSLVGKLSTRLQIAGRAVRILIRHPTVGKTWLRYRITGRAI